MAEAYLLALIIWLIAVFVFMIIASIKNKAKTKTITDLIDAQTKKTAAGKNNLKEIKTSETSENVEQEILLKQAKLLMKNQKKVSPTNLTLKTINST